MFRRPRRPPFRRRRPFVPRPRHPRQAHAERLLAAGDFAEAAETFQELSRETEEEGLLVPAGHLALRAACCHLGLEDYDQADQQAERAIRLFIQARRPRLVRQVLPRVLNALEDRGRQVQAEALRQEVEEAFGDLMEGQPLGPAAARWAANLPGKCPNCGAPIKARDVAWAGPGAAECPYCGSVVKAGE